MNVVVIGNSQAVLGFSLAGVRGRPAANAEEAIQALDETLSARDVGIILVTEDVAAMIETRMSELKMKSTVPLVVEIPAPGGPPAGKQALSEIVKRAIGIKI